MFPIWVLIVACAPHTHSCEPYIFQYAPEYEMGMSDSRIRVTPEFCKNSVAGSMIRDGSRLSPETADTYELGPQYIYNIRGVTYDPKSAVCWPLTPTGPE